MTDKEKRARARRQRQTEIFTFVMMGVMLATCVLAGIGKMRDIDDLLILGEILIAVELVTFDVVLHALAERETETPPTPAPAAPPTPAPRAEQSVPTGAAVPRELLAAGMLGERFYQMVPGREALHFVYLEWGDSHSAAAMLRRVTPTWDDAALAAQYQKGFAIPWAEITALELSMQDSILLRWHSTVGKLTIHTAERTRRMLIVAERDADRDLTPAQLRGFFAPAAAVLTVETAIYARQQAEDRAEREQGALRHPLAKKLLLPLQLALPAVIAAVGGLLLLLLYHGLPHAGLDWALVALGLLPVVLASALPQVFSVRSLFFPARFPRAGEPTQCDVGLGLLVGALALFIRCADYHIGNAAFPRLMAIFLVLAFGLTVLMLRRTVLRHKLLYSFFVVVLTAALLFGAAIELNGLLDTAPARRETVAVAEKRDIVGRTERCQVRIEGQEEWIDVTRELYDALEIGDGVMLITHPGALGIPYTETAFFPID